MSVLHRYQPSIRRAVAPVQGVPSVASFSRLGQLNAALLFLACAALVLYVVQANRTSAAAWRIDDAAARLEQARGERDTLVAHYAALEDRAQLARLAEAAGMQMDGPVAHIVDPKPVAVR